MKRYFLLLLSCFLLSCTSVKAPCTPYELTAEPPDYFVILDYGHGGFDCGAVGLDTGVKESDLNLLVGERVARALEDRGCFVLRTRTGTDALAGTKRDDMALRGAILCSEGADCTVSIHMNKFSDRSVKGPMCYFQAGSEGGKTLAGCVIDALCAAIGQDPRLANPGNNFVTRIPSVPSVLIECGFLSNPEDEQRLMDPDYQQRIADGIAEGVMTYLQKEDPSDQERSSD